MNQSTLQNLNHSIQLLDKIAESTKETADRARLMKAVGDDDPTAIAMADLAENFAEPMHLMCLHIGFSLSLLRDELINPGGRLG